MWSSIPVSGPPFRSPRKTGPLPTGIVDQISPESRTTSHRNQWTNCAGIRTPAPKRSQSTTWKDFIAAHMAVLAGTDFFTVEVLTWRGLVTYYVLFFLLSVAITRPRREINSLQSRATAVAWAREDGDYPVTPLLFSLIAACSCLLPNA